MWEKLIERGREPPDAYYEQPEIPDHLREIWSAFSDLGTERQIGMGVGPIPSSHLRRYLRVELGLSGDGADRVFSIIRQVDDEYLRLNNSPKEKSDDPKMRSRVPFDDSKGMRSLVRELGKPKAQPDKTKARPT